MDKSYPELTDFSITFLDLTQLFPKSRIAACSRSSQPNSGDVAAGSRLWRDHEVEVPPCERGANRPHPSPRGRGDEARKSNRSADASGVCHRLLFSLPKQAQGVTSAPHTGEKTLLLGLKTSRQRLGQDQRSEPDMDSLCVWYKCMEGMFYLIAVAIFEACLACLFCFPSPWTSPPGRGNCE